jgi:hypothetical protein
LLAVYITQHNGAALLRQPRSQVGSQGAFAAATFAINHSDNRHGMLQSSNKNLVWNKKRSKSRQYKPWQLLIY